MPTRSQSLSLIGQVAFHAVEAAPRPLVGFANDYPAGLATAMHSHARAQLLYAVSGVMRIATPTAAYTVPPTMALFVPADALHSIKMDGPVAMRALVLREDAARKAAKDTVVISVSHLLRELIIAACAEPLEWAEDGRGHFLSGLALDEIARANAMPLGLPLPNDPRLRRAIELVRSRPGEPNGLEHLAAVAGASSRTLARLFRAETGMSFRQWRQQARMTEAMVSLCGGSSIARVAALAGFSNQAAFGASFLSVFAMTPRQAQMLGRN